MKTFSTMEKVKAIIAVVLFAATVLFSTISNEQGLGAPRPSMPNKSMSPVAMQDTTYSPVSLK